MNEKKSFKEMLKIFIADTYKLIGDILADDNFFDAYYMSKILTKYLEIMNTME